MVMAAISDYPWYKAIKTEARNMLKKKLVAKPAKV